jgi:E3 ubiquitin-protein ligase HERC2
MSLKQHVVELASNIGVLNTIQSAAQATLQAGWSILLPTADERAKTLSALLPSTGNKSIQSLHEGMSPEMYTGVWSDVVLNILLNLHVWKPCIVSHRRRDTTPLNRQN